VELVELHVGDFGASFEGKSHAVSGRDVGICRVRVELTGSAGGEDDGRRFEGPVLARAQVKCPHADDVSAPDEKARRKREVQDGDARLVAGTAECAFDFSPGPVAAGMDDAGAAVGRLPSERKLAAERIEGDAVADEVPDPGWTFGAEDARSRFVNKARAGFDRIGEMLFRGIKGSDGGGDAALRPTRVAVVDGPLGQDEDWPELTRFERYEEP